MDRDPLYHSIIESTHVLTNVLTRLETTQRLGVRLQGFAIVLIGFCLLFTGYLVWQHLGHSQAHAAMTQALIETLQRMPRP